MVFTTVPYQFLKRRHQETENSSLVICQDLPTDKLMRNVGNYGNFPGSKSMAGVARHDRDQSPLVTCSKRNKLN